MDHQTAQYIEAIAAQKANAAVEAKLGPDMLAKLASTDTQIVEGVPWRRFDVAAPAPLIPIKGYTMGLNDRILSFTGASTQTQILPLSFDLDSYCYAWTAAVYSTDSDATFPPANFANALDTFTIQFRLAQGRQYQTEPVLGSAVLGDAKFPRYLGLPTIRFPRGTVLQVIVTPLVENLRVDIDLWCIELTPYAGNVA